MADWAQHVLRFYDGRALSSLRGHRVVWAIFNTVLREEAHKKGSLLLHKHSGQAILTKKDLLDMYAAREDLSRKLSSFGADIPTTSMHWRRQGNDLEWIVRQMSWAAPWTSTGKRLHAQKFANKTTRKYQPDPHQLPDVAAAPAPLQLPNPMHSEASDAESPGPAEKTRKPQLLDEISDTESLWSLSDLDPAPAARTPSPSVHESSHSAPEHQQEYRNTTRKELQEVKAFWSSLPQVTCVDHYGYNRCPAHWFTRNFPYNHAFNLHRFHRAIASLQQEESEESFPDISARCKWVLDNPDLVAVIHAIGVELSVRKVTPHVVLFSDEQPFQYWLRFE